jgi:hypothetical protein
MPDAIKDGVNPHLRNRYATLGALWAAARPILAAHDLALVQTFGDTATADGPVIVTTLYHKSGQSLTSSLPMPVAKASDPQAVGSAITYGRRYAMAAMLGIMADDDDDAEGAKDRPATAGHPNNPRPAPKSAPKRPEGNPELLKPADPGTFESMVADLAQKTGAVIPEDLPVISQFFETTANGNNGGKEALARLALANLERFKTGFKKWSQAQAPSVDQASPIVPATVKVVEAELRRLGRPGHLPPGLATRYGTGDPSELTEAQGREAAWKLKNFN